MASEKRLKAAESDDLGDIVERTTWVGLFLKEVELAQMRLKDLQRLAEDAKSDLEPSDRWLQARHNKWDEESEEGKRSVRHQVESAEYQHRMKKLDELGKKNHEASSKRYRAEEEVDFAEEGYEAARLDNLGEIIERAAFTPKRVPGIQMKMDIGDAIVLKCLSKSTPEDEKSFHLPFPSRADYPSSIESAVQLPVACYEAFGRLPIY